MRGIIVPLRSRTFMDSVRGALGISPPGRSVLAEIVDGVPRRYAPMPKPRIARSQLGMADGIHYRDSKQPFPVGPQAAVTLLTTDKLLWPGSLTALVANYLWAGKAVALTAFGTLTTGATPGNLNIELYYGTTDAGGTLLASSAALTLVANQTTIPWVLTAFLRCRGVGGGRHAVRVGAARDRDRCRRGGPGHHSRFGARRGDWRYDRRGRVQRSDEALGLDRRERGCAGHGLRGAELKRR
jgi:hypothetical protein